MPPIVYKLLGHALHACHIALHNLNNDLMELTYMVTYDQVKSKLESAIMQILEDMVYKRIVFANEYANAVRSFVKGVLNELNNALHVKTHYSIDTYFAELYTNETMKEIGEKAVKPAYNDDTTEINGRIVIPFDVFEFKPDLYENYSKLMGEKFSEYTVMFRIPINESPPDGEFEDASYVYYMPTIFYSNYEFVHDLYEEINAYGELPNFAEFDIYACYPLKVRFIKGVFDYFRRDIDSATIWCDIGSGGVVKAYDETNDKWRELAYKFVILAWNYTDYTVEVMVSGKPHKVSAHHVAVYVYLTDIHLKATPIKIVEAQI